MYSDIPDFEFLIFFINSCFIWTNWLRVLFQWIASELFFYSKLKNMNNKKYHTWSDSSKLTPSISTGIVEQKLNEHISWKTQKLQMFCINISAIFTPNVINFLKITFKCLLMEWKVYDNYRLIHGLFHISLVISTRPWDRHRGTISVEGWWQGQDEKCHVLGQITCYCSSQKGR